MIKLLTLILAESALETIPEELWGHPLVRHFSKKKGKHPKVIILDRSYHHHAMKNLKNSEKRGRPDIIHFSLLEALGSPLNKEGLLRVYVHTVRDYVVTVSPKIRLPKNFNRFIGLMEDLFEHGKVPPNDKPLLTLEVKTLSSLIEDLKPTYTLAFSRTGKAETLDEAILRLAKEENPITIIGGFPHGSLSEKTLKTVDDVVCIDPETLETWTVTSRLIYEYERATSLPKKRLKIK